MFEKYSMTGSGAAIVVVLKVLLPLFGIEVPEDMIIAFWEAVLTIVGTIMLVYGQLRRKDLVGGIIRK